MYDQWPKSGKHESIDVSSRDSDISHEIENKDFCAKFTKKQ